ncbi:MAG: hypothetical protein WBA00_01360 [Rhodococcus sp. (in: high G+C Gram-positive bacteria)]
MVDGARLVTGLLVELAAFDVLLMHSATPITSMSASMSGDHASLGVVVPNGLGVGSGDGR